MVVSKYRLPTLDLFHTFEAVARHRRDAGRPASVRVGDTRVGGPGHLPCRPWRQRKGSADHGQRFGRLCLVLADAPPGTLWGRAAGSRFARSGNRSARLAGHGRRGRGGSVRVRSSGRVGVPPAFREKRSIRCAVRPTGVPIPRCIGPRICWIRPCCTLNTASLPSAGWIGGSGCCGKG